MMETLALNNLWNYIQNLPLTDQNRIWLADKLLNGKKQGNGVIQQNLLERLDTLSNLKDDWDEEGAKPIDSRVVQNARLILKNLNESQLNGWELFPAVNQTLTFQNTIKDAMLSIGSDDYTFVYSDNGVLVDCEENQPFSLSKIIGVFEKINV